MNDPFERAVAREGEQRRDRRRRRARAGFRWHAMVFVAVNVLLVGIWGSIRLQHDGAHPWFLYPLLGWGIGLAFHYAAVRSAYRTRHESAHRGPETSP